MSPADRPDPVWWCDDADGWWHLRAAPRPGLPDDGAGDDPSTAVAGGGAPGEEIGEPQRHGVRRATGAEHFPPHMAGPHHALGHARGAAGVEQEQVIG